MAADGGQPSVPTASCWHGATEHLDQTTTPLSCAAQEQVLIHRPTPGPRRESVQRHPLTAV